MNIKTFLKRWLRLFLRTVGACLAIFAGLILLVWAFNIHAFLGFTLAIAMLTGLMASNWI